MHRKYCNRTIYTFKAKETVMADDKHTYKNGTTLGEYAPEYQPMTNNGVGE